MRLQNTIAAVVFVILLVCATCMQLLNSYPSSGALWYLNVTFAREARPVLELLDHIAFAGLTQNILIILALIGLCGLAVYRNCKMLTSATTHLALYAVIFAGIASYSRTFGSLKAASVSATDMAALAGALDPGQRALTMIIVILLITCLINHYQIISDLLRDRLLRDR